MNDINIKLSVLWIIHVLSWIVGDLLRTVQPGYIEDNILNSTEISNEILLVGSIIYTFQFAMIFLSLTLDAKVNRIANIVLGSIFCLLNIVHLVDSIQEPAWEIYLGLVYLVFTSLIVWHAWKWPAQEDN